VGPAEFCPPELATGHSRILECPIWTESGGIDRPRKYIRVAGIGSSRSLSRRERRVPQQGFLAASDPDSSFRHERACTCMRDLCLIKPAFLRSSI
jgi:hypothetical protein